jgi:hypothetical protein
MNNRRRNYPSHREYQAVQLKPLLNRIEKNFESLNFYVQGTERFNKTLKECQDILWEIQLRLD